ncbi:MAG: ROK family protein [Cyclobacteriaceae bacterium]
MRKIVTGVDIGGSHITAALVDLDACEVIEESITRQKVDSKGSADEILQNWSNAISECNAKVKDLECSGVGMAIPGPFDYENGISLLKDQGKFKSLYKINVKERLQAKLGQKVLMQNDAECYMLGEYLGGAAKSTKRAIGLTLGTGIGSAYVIDGVATDAKLWESPMRDGIAEDYISTNWFLKRYQELAGGVVKNVKELSDKYDHDAQARQVFEEFAISLSEFIGSFVSTIDPEVIVIGGNIMKAKNLFIPKVNEILANKGISLPIDNSVLGEDAAILGAASLIK